MSETTYIIDGSGYIFRAYYGVTQPLTNDEGLPTNALFGFTRMLTKFLKQVTSERENMPRILVVFDAGRKNFRHEIYEDYKANRSECPEDLVPQMPYFRQIAEALGFEILEEEGLEADDLIASIVHTEPSPEVVIVSADKDLTQLVNDSVTMWDPMRDRTFSIETVKEHFGVYPHQIRDYLSLIGDSSDNIPGVKGLGPKSASRLLEHFESLEALLQNIPHVAEIKGLRGAKSLKEKIESNIDTIRLSQKLVRLKDDCTISILNETWSGPTDDISDLFSYLGFKSLLKEIDTISSTYDPSISVLSEPQEDSDKSYKLITTSELQSILPKIDSIDNFAFDTETTSLDPHEAVLVGISFSWSPHEAYFVSTVKDGQLDSSALKETKKHLEPILTSDSIRKYGSNLKYDIRILSNHNIDVSGPLFDTMIASQVRSPDSRDHGLKKLCFKILHEEMPSFDDMMGDHENILEVPLDRLTHYACYDADATFRIAEFLDTNTNSETNEFGYSQRKLLDEIEMPLIYVLAQMEESGVGIDQEMLSSLEKNFSNQIRQLTEKIHTVASKEFNINSPKQLAEVLFEDLGIDTTGVKKTKSGYSTDVKVLSSLIDSHEIISLILEYREINKLLTTYVQALSRLVSQDTGRIHASFNQAITATGRLSSSDPNLQNIPIKTERGRQLRQLFVANEGNTLIKADYSQIELRVLAHLSGDEAMIEAFKVGEDIHAQTAIQLFGRGAYEDDPQLRRVAKTINFGIVYGMGAFRLANDLGVSRGEAQEFIDAYFNQYPGVKSYFENLEENLESSGYVETMCGRRRYLKDLAAIGRDKGYIKRSLMNAPIQGTASEIVKIAMLSLKDASDDFYSAQGIRPLMILQVHDELVFEVDKNQALTWGGILKEKMESAVLLSVPLSVDMQTNERWGS